MINNGWIVEFKQISLLIPKNKICEKKVKKKINLVLTFSKMFY